MNDITKNIDNDILKDVGFADLLSYGALNEKLNTTKEFKEKIKQENLSLIGNDDHLNILLSRVENKTPKDIGNMTDSEIDDIYTIDDLFIDVNFITKENDNVKKNKYKRDFLIHISESDKMFKKFDAEFEAFEKEMNAKKIELDNLFKSANDLTAAVILKAEEKCRETTDEIVKKQYLKFIDAMKDAIALNRIYKCHIDHGTKNTMRDALSDDLSIPIFKKYEDVIKGYKIKTDIRRFINLETRFLPEKYHKHPDLFLFIMIRYISYKDSYKDIDFTGVFFVSFLTNVKKLFKNELDENDKQEFLNNIMKILDLFIKD